MTRLFLVFSPNVVSVLGHDLPERGINNPNLQLLSSIANDLQGLQRILMETKGENSSERLWLLHCRRRDPIECILGPLIIHNRSIRSQHVKIMIFIILDGRLSLDSY